MSVDCPAWLEDALRAAPASKTSLAAVRLGASLDAASKFRLTSAAFENGEELDPCFTAEEDDSVAPPVEWTTPPEGTAEMALIVERLSDKDEPFCHWLVWGLAAQRGKLMEGEVPPRVGKNGFNNSDWALPTSPEGDQPHRFAFQLFALDTVLDLKPGAKRKDLLAAMEGHVIGFSALGTVFSGFEDDDASWDDDDLDD